MPNTQEQINFLSELMKKSETDLLFEDQATISISHFEYDRLLEIKASLELLANQTESQNISTEKTNQSKLPVGFFDNPLAITSKDLVGLPEELVKELSDLDSTETELLELFEMAGGTLVLDKIIAGLFHLTGKQFSRQTITAKLYRMSKKDLIRSLPKKKGVYTTDNEDDL